MRNSLIGFFLLGIILCFPFLLWGQNATIQLKSGAIPSIQMLPVSKADFSQFQNNQVENRFFAFLQFKKIPSADEKAKIQEKGIILLDYLPDMAFTASIPLTINPNELYNFGVEFIVNIQPEFKLSRELAIGNYPSHALSGNQIELAVFAYKTIDQNDFLNTLKRNDFEVLDKQVSRNGAVVKVNISDIKALASIAAIKYVEPVEAPPVKDGIKGRANGRANTLSSAPGTGFDGTGVVIAVADDGGIGHEDFRGRFTDFNTSQGGTHGDMTAGLTSGCGNLDPTKVGMGTGTYLNMYGISGYPHVVNAISNLNSLGTVITSTSYSQGCGGLYDATARDLDEDVHDQNVLLHVFSAGNSASSSCSSIYGSLVASDGRRYGNITGGRKAAKNSIAVANLLYDDSRVASSSRGPCEDGRIKPDISATGNSQQSTGPNNTYLNAGGTSAAAPTTAGIATMLYQAYKSKNGNNNPNSALIKGIMLNTADDLGRPGPDFDFGWGRVNARRAYEVINNTQYINSSIAQGGNNNHSITVPANTKQVKVMVIWLDPEGSTSASKALVNNLDMTLSSSSQTYQPWILNTNATIAALQQNATRGVDNVNNMEQVTIDNPSAGTYTVNVTGSAVPVGPQAYHVIYYFVPDEIVMTYPSGGEFFVPGETEFLQWDAFGNTGNFTLQYSTNNGSSWTTVSSSISGAERHYDWVVPSAITGQALVRITRSGLTGSSTAFNILGLPGNISVAANGGGNATVSWTAVAGANGYDIYSLGTKYMEIIGSSTTTSFNLTGLSNGGNNWYSVRAKHSGNGITGRRANAVQYSHSTNAASCTDCTAGSLNSFPYSESFETGLGGWCQGQLDDIDWTRQSGTTPSSNTGPASANNGTFYMFTESSGSNNNKNASLESPCFDLSGVSGATLTFDNHMYGATMGTLKVDGSTDNGLTWTNVWTQSGDQGNQWNSSTVDLTSFAGGNVILRFYGTTGTSFTSDISIDNIKIEVVTGGGCASTISSFPYSENFDGLTNCANTAFACAADGACGLGAGWTNGSGDDIDWSVDDANTPSSSTGPSADHTSGSGKYLFTEASSCFNNTGLLLSPCFDFSSLTNPELTFWYHMYGAGMGRLGLQVSTDGGSTWSTAVWALSGDQGNAWNQATVNLSSYAGQAQVQFRFTGLTGASYTSDMAIDDVSISNTTTSLCPSAISSFPYTQNFDGLAVCGNTGFACIADGTCGLGAGWTNASGDAIDWSVDNGTTPSSSTGPTSDHTSGSGNYLYTEASSCFNNTGSVISPCFNLSTASGPSLSFWYHLYGNTMGSLSVQVSTDGGGTWSSDVWSMSGNQGNAWNQATVNLSAYAGQASVQLRFTGTTGTSYTSDMAIDDVVLDAGTSALVENTISSTNELANNQSVRLYPNPTKDILTLETEGLAPGAMIKVFNLVGQSLDFVPVRTTSEKTYEINASDLTPGIYLLQIQSDQYSKAIKFSVVE